MSDLRVVLVVPPGLHPHIYPWGVHLLADSLASDGVEANVLDLSAERSLADLAARYGAELREAYRVLQPRAAALFFGHTLERSLLLGVLARAGERFPAIARERRLLRLGIGRARLRHLAEGLRALQADYRSVVTARLRDQLPDDRDTLWGISTYDYTLIDVLHVAELIRQLQPETSIVLGGDYFDNRTATALMQGADGLDGVVVGYGEETLRELARRRAAGRSVRDAVIPGLVTRSNADVSRCDAGAKDRLLTLGKSKDLNVPAAYTDAEALSRLRLARAQSDRRVRVLTQRGCSWGNCTFCSQIDRRMYRALDPRVVLGEVERALPAEPRGDLQVILDADENDLGIVLPMLDILNQSAASAGEGARASCEFWLMVRKFGAELPRYLARKENRVAIRVILNIESLNLQTIRRMQKGVTILDSLQAVKAIRDVGHVVETNYFMNYPLEKTGDVAREAELLGRVIHLLTPPRTQLSGFSYLANGRDEIHFDADRYEVSVGRDRADVWVGELFGLDLPISIWATSYRKRRPAADPLQWIAYAFHRYAMANKTAIRARAALAGLGAQPRGRAHGWLRSVTRHLAAPAWRLLCEALQIVTGDHAYRRRSQVFAYLDRLARDVGRPADRRSGFAQWGRRLAGRLAPPARTQPSYLVIHRDALVKRCALPGRRESWARPLEPLEIELLRYLYWRRKESEVAAHFAGRALPEVIERLLARFEEEGAVLREGRSLLSLANDPGYWKTPAAAIEGPAARTGFGLPTPATESMPRRAAG